LSSEGASTVFDRIELDRFVLEAVDEVLKSVFGSKSVKVIYDSLDRRMGLKRQDIPSRIEDFCAGIEMLLGSNNSVLDRLMLRGLCSKLQLDYDQSSKTSFLDYVQLLRRRFGESEVIT